MNQKNITLIGAVHTDPKGKSRLERLLNHLQPEILTVEASEAAERFTDELLASVRHAIQGGSGNGVSPPLIDILIETIRTTRLYETVGCEQYAQLNKVPLLKIDLPDLDYKTMLPEGFAKNAQTVKFLQERRLNKSSLLGLIRYLREGQGTWKEKIGYWMLYKPLCIIRKFAESYERLRIRERDTYMFERLQELSTSNPGKTIVHVGGMGHMLDFASWGYKEMPTLASLLPESRVYRLQEADHL